jgi:hypothetical protein
MFEILGALQTIAIQGKPEENSIKWRKTTAL